MHYIAWAENWCWMNGVFKFFFPFGCMFCSKTITRKMQIFFVKIQLLVNSVHLLIHGIWQAPIEHQTLLNCTFPPCIPCYTAKERVFRQIKMLAVLEICWKNQSARAHRFENLFRVIFVADRIVCIYWQLHWSELFAIQSSNIFYYCYR